MAILILDNYDSFTYNLFHYVQEFSTLEIDVIRNDKIAVSEVEKYEKIILSPGPGLPSEAGIMCDLIRKYGKHKSILGVCLGHQAIAEVYGAQLENMEKVMHGVASEISIMDSNEILFKNIPSKIEVGRYHSWVVSSQNFPDELRITSMDADNRIMSLRHKEFDVCGIQFHPESILTPLGKAIIKNWINS